LLNVSRPARRASGTQRNEVGFTPAHFNVIVKPLTPPSAHHTCALLQAKNKRTNTLAVNAQRRHRSTWRTGSAMHASR
jgi:hypothetical protein